MICNSIVGKMFFISSVKSKKFNPFNQYGFGKYEKKSPHLPIITLPHHHITLPEY
jgi:hypothetical protein